jgi:putative membrane protein
VSDQQDPQRLAVEQVAQQPGPPDDAGFRRLSPLTPVARSAIFFVAAAYAGGRELLQDGPLTGVAIIAVAVLVVGALFGFASWYRTRFRITPTELRIDTGVLSRRSRRVRLDRVLEISINQPFVARLLGLAELKVETATTESEVSLSYLPVREAHDVRQVLLDYRAAATAAPTPPGTEPAAAAPAAQPVLLLQVPIRWQLIGLVASGETVLLLVLGAGALALFLSGVPLGAMGVGLVSVLGAAVSLVRKVVDWWDWKISALPTGVQVRHGMFSLSTRTFNVERLQGVRVTEPLLQRPFGMARLELSVAGGAKDNGDDGNGVAIPVAPREIVWRMAADLIGADPALVPVSAPPARATWLRPISRTWLRFGMDDRLIVSRTGWVSRRTDLVPLARVQSLRLHQGPVQRLLRLASVHADSPVGLVHASGPHRDPADARALVVEGVERARRARMPAPSPLRRVAGAEGLPDPASHPPGL